MKPATTNQKRLNRNISAFTATVQYLIVRFSTVNTDNRATNSQTGISARVYSIATSCFHISITHLLQLKPDPVEESQPVGLGTFSRIHCLIALCHTGRIENRSITDYLLSHSHHSLLHYSALFLIITLASNQLKLTALVLPHLFFKFVIAHFVFSIVIKQRNKKKKPHSAYNFSLIMFVTSISFNKGNTSTGNFSEMIFSTIDSS